MDKAMAHDSNGQKPANLHSNTALDWRRKASDHVAFGLLVYTGLHIFVTMTQLKSGGGSVLPYFALIVLVAAIIPACRWMEKRWEGLSDAEAGDRALAPAFKREMALLWLAAIGLPLALTFAFKALATVL